jgi:hypothetical protein
MVSQIFKYKIPNEVLFDFLNNISIKTDKYYIVNFESFKKGNFNESIQAFYNTIKEYYYLSKRFYLERKNTYTNFTTVLRQICKFNEIPYTSQIKYDKSNYDIIYNIFYL